MTAADEIRDAIGGGSISFERFMDIALYGEHGFYNTVGWAGRRGDFITAPEVGPLFGAVVAAALDAWWRELGEPGEFTVVDAGAGPGTLARSVLAACPACTPALRYVAVETSAIQRTRHPDGVTSTATMPSAPFTGVVLANELLDNLPFRLFVMDGRWLEAHVVVQGDGSFAEVLRRSDDGAESILPETARHGARAPVQQRAGRWLAGAMSSVQRGRVVVIDYATPSTAVLAARPWREWLRTYRGHQRGEHYLRSPGEQDITTDVAIDQLVAAVGEPAAVRSQSRFLQRWGIDQMVEEGRRLWTAQAATPTLAALTMRSRIREAEALLAEPGLGDFQVVEYVV